MSLLTKIYALGSHKLLHALDASRKDPCAFQTQVFNSLLQNGGQSAFGVEYHFHSINGFEAFQKRVPLHQYENLAPYIDRLRKGESYVLWNQKTRWFAKSSGTSGSKSKYIPVTPDALHHCHYRGMHTILASYIRNNPKSRMFNGRSLTLGGSSQIDECGRGKSRYGDLSAILLSNTPSLVERFRTPPRHIALQDNFEKKLDQIAQHIARQNITNFSGVPSWNLVLMRRVLEYAKKQHLLQVWPHLELFMHGGINFTPYREQYQQLIPSEKMHYVETYNASEGFFALQDQPDDPGMLLLPHCGVFYEFIPLKRLPEALSGSYYQFLTMENVVAGEDYALVISTNGGLWRYLIGDTVRFSSLYPHRILITGRTKLFINAFGEELVIEQAEKALAACCQKHQALVSEFTVAPVFMDERAKGAHQWLIEFAQAPASTEAFAQDLDAILCAHNSDYEAKRAGNATMLPLQLQALPVGTFYAWLKERGKLGGQHKVPRLSGSRDYVDELLAICQTSPNAL